MPWADTNPSASAQCGAAPSPISTVLTASVAKADSADRKPSFEIATKTSAAARGRGTAALSTTHTTSPPRLRFSASFSNKPVSRGPLAMVTAMPSRPSAMGPAAASTATSPDPGASAAGARSSDDTSSENATKRSTAAAPGPVPKRCGFGPTWSQKSWRSGLSSRGGYHSQPARTTQFVPGFVDAWDRKAFVVTRTRSTARSASAGVRGAMAKSVGSLLLAPPRLAMTRVRMRSTLSVVSSLVMSRQSYCSAAASRKRRRSRAQCARRCAGLATSASPRALWKDTLAMDAGT